MHVHRVRDRGEHLQVGLGGGDGRAPAPNEPGRPSQFTNVPAFSATAATGSTTSARSVTALARSSRLTRNGVTSSACQRRLGVRQVGGSTPAMTMAPISPAAAAARICRGVPAGVGGQRRHTPGPGDVGPRGLVGDAAAAGQQRWAARLPRWRRARPRGGVSRPAGRRSRRPARPPRSARRAPRPAARRPGSRRRAGAGLCSARATCGPPDPAPTAHVRSAAGSPAVAAGILSPASRVSSARAFSIAVSSPGTVGSSVPDIRLSPGLASAASEYTARRPVRAALRSRRNTIGDSSCGLEPGQQHGGRLACRPV